MNEVGVRKGSVKIVELERSTTTVFGTSVRTVRKGKYIVG